MRILNELRVHFSELHILKGLGCFALVGTADLGWKLDFDIEGTEFTEGRSRWGNGDAEGMTGSLLAWIASETGDMVAG